MAVCGLATLTAYFSGWDNGAMRDSILHLADLHLGANPDDRLDDATRSRLLQARERVLRLLTEWIAREESRIALVVIAGDLFDRHDPAASIVAEVRAALSELTRLVPVILVPGNHDEYSYSQSVFRQGGWPGVIVTDSEPQLVWKGEIGERPCAIVSAAYQAGKVKPGQKLCLPARKDVLNDDTKGVLIGLFHATLADHFPEEFLRNERCFWLSHQEAAELGYDYLALGHFHARREWRIGRCLAHYPGPPLGPRMTDPGSGHLSIVRLGKRDLGLDSYPAGPLLGCTWGIFEVEVQPADSPDEIVERIAARCRETAKDDRVLTLVVGRLRGNTAHADLAEQVQTELQARGLSCVVAPEGLEQIMPPDVQALAAEESLVGYFVRLWKQWQTQERVTPAEATTVLYEGLLALGWHREKRGQGDQ